MNITPSMLKTQARQAMRAARPRVLPMTLLFLLLTSGLGLLVDFLFTNPLTRILELAYSGLDLPRILQLAMVSTGSAGLFAHILILLLTIVLDFGYAWWCLGTTRGGIGEYRDLTSAFALAGRIILLRIVVFTYYFFWYMALMTAAMMASTILMFASGLGLPVAIPCFIVAAVLFVCKILQYSQASYCLMDAPELGIFAAVAESRRYMRGQIKRYILFLLSFIGWLILGAVVQAVADGLLVLLLGAPLLLSGDLFGAVWAATSFPLFEAASFLLSLPFFAWLTCYFSMSKCCFYNSLRSGTQL